MFQLEETASTGDSVRETEQENEVYVNITVSGNLGSLTGLLLPVMSSGQDDLGQLPYQVSVSESNHLLNTGDLLIQHNGILINKSILEEDIKSENDISIDDSPGKSACHYELPSDSAVETCQQPDSSKKRQEFLGENGGVKNLVTYSEHDSSDVDRTIWPGDDKHSFENHVAHKNENTKSSDSLYSVRCEPTDCNNGSNEADVQEICMQSGKRSCGKKKDYEKLAPFKFFCTLCSFKSKRESHYQRHLELHSKVSNSLRLNTVKILFNKENPLSLQCVIQCMYVYYKPL